MALDAPTQAPQTRLEGAPAHPGPTNVDQTPPTSAGKKWRKRAVLGLVLVAGLGFATVKANDYWTLGRFLQSTDDAYLQADISQISPEVTGHIQEVAVRENHMVKAGQVLFRIEDSDYRNALEQAKSQINTHTQSLIRIAAQTDAARAAVSQAEALRRSAEAALRNAQTTAERIQNLNTSSFASQAQLDDTIAAREEAEAQLANANATVASANANVAVLQAQYAEAETETRALNLAVDQAQRNLDRTILRAPYDGIVANIAGETGEMVSPGTILAAVVPTGSLYVEANFKETQLVGVTPGAVAHLSFDMLPDVEIEGHVDSIAPATGAMFSLLPAENATGNFTKIVQRVPVRIALPDAALQDPRLRAGLSVTVSVDSRTGTPAAAGI